MNDTFNISVPIQPDEEGMVGRECPEQNCEKYFKVKNGTGIVNNPAMYCPYCSYRGVPREFFTKEQIEYAKSIAVRHVTDMIGRELKKLERHSFKGPFFSMNIKVKSQPAPIRYYVEKQLQENIVCENCKCEYAIYGIFAVCPDCGQHNIFQIFSKNIDLIMKQLCLEDELYRKFGETNRAEIDSLMKDIKGKTVENACEDAVTVFETFCKRVYELNNHNAVNPALVLQGNPFQSLDRAKEVFFSQFNFDIFHGLTADEIDKLYLLFNKRHILTHNLGIIDQRFLVNTGLRQDILNHKVEISKQEVITSLSTLSKISEAIRNNLF